MMMTQVWICYSTVLGVLKGFMCHIWHAWQTTQGPASSRMSPHTCSDTTQFSGLSSNLHPLLGNNCPRKMLQVWICHHNVVPVLEDVYAKSNMYEESKRAYNYLQPHTPIMLNNLPRISGPRSGNPHPLLCGGVVQWGWHREEYTMPRGSTSELVGTNHLSHHIWNAKKINWSWEQNTGQGQTPFPICHSPSPSMIPKCNPSRGTFTSLQ